MTDISKMIGRLEKATGPDRELGARLVCLARGYLFVSWEPRGTALNPHAIEVCAEKDGERFAFWAIDPTGSLDAALTLKQSRGYSIIEMENGSGYQVDLDNQLVDAPTAELGVCIAALKARSANTA